MKKAYLLLFAVLLIISSCLKNQVHPIIGKWDYTETIQVEEGVYLLWEIEISEDKFINTVGLKSGTDSIKADLIGSWSINDDGDKLITDNWTIENLNYTDWYKFDSTSLEDYKTMMLNGNPIKDTMDFTLSDENKFLTLIVDSTEFSNFVRRVDE
jgi:hypothetical protein